MQQPDTAAQIQRAWQRELPGVPTGSIGIITRIWRGAKLLSDERRRTLSRLGIDRATLDLLSVLRRSGAPYRLTTSELAARSLVSAGAITQRVARAEAAGFVEVSRTASGARTTGVTLTAEGHRWVDRSVTELLTAEETLVEHLSPDELAELARLLESFLTGLHVRLGVPDTPEAGH
ncbi:MarR family winged helix-turn-helix transcriptional regulator [Sciscionella marina]|uniref:MarR family winged helix-turn-helix transcriptional regulator n=1 Tax=Sciscionella marina TaxID=508770 RepID=UPI0003609DF1|nr:MarR family winged helix-turn-helix transcriptional regulator [Sciscionella marina]